MVTIQYISYGKRKFENMVCSTLAEPNSLDTFDINIIDLSDNNLWKNKNANKEELNDKADLINLQKMISESRQTKIIYLFPQNLRYRYSYEFISNHKDYIYFEDLKNMLLEMSYIFATYLRIPYEGSKFSFIYEKNKTKINNFSYNSDFYFIDLFGQFEHITQSEKSNRLTTIRYGGVVFSTLSFNKPEEIIVFLNILGYLAEKEEIPNWLEDYSFSNDNELKQNLESLNEKVEELKNKIIQTQSDLDINRGFKSILISSGDSLVKKVFEVLDDIFKTDLYKFEDKKEMDFLFEFNGITFIGEIKGISSNAKRENVSQLDVHYYKYIDNLGEENKKENIKPLLIINHQRQKDLKEREPISKDVIGLANRNKSLIIETKTSLKLYEKFLNKEIDTKYIFNLFKNEIGLLTI